MTDTVDTEDRIREREAHYKWALEWRGIEEPCKTCRGAGLKTYSNTATWRGGAGGNAMTVSVCDRCWGSGDEREHWTDLRRLRNTEEDRVRQAAATRLASSLGVNFLTTGHREAIRAVIVELNRLTNKRKPPVGDDFFARRAWEHVCSKLASHLEEVLALELLKKG